MQRLVLALIALAVVAGLVMLLWRGVRSGAGSGTEVATSGPASRISFMLLLGVIAYVAFVGAG